MNDRDESRGPFSLYAVLVALGTVTAAVAVVLFAAYHTCAFEGCPDIDLVQGYMPDEASMVLDRDGDEVARLYHVNRVVVGLDSLPEHVIHAVIATEDRQFYEHGGVDWSRVFGALWENVRSRGIEEGFSTITMQVARNIFPEQLPVEQRTLNRKVSEVRVARLLEGRYTKDEILALYLNQIYFGSGAWGIEAAAQEYFGKPATELSLGEAALLAGLPQAPSRLNPRRNMERALERRASVLRRMANEGFITEEESAAVRETEPELARSRQETPDRAAYFIEHVRRQLEDRLGDAVYTRGYTIHTTLDLDAQAVAERQLRQQLQAVESGHYGAFPHPTYAGSVSEPERATRPNAPYLQGAVVVMAARSGDVLALVGGRDFEDSRFNRATQALRQPGSAFKPFVYAAAIENGYPPTSILEDTPYRVVRDGREWTPSNFGGSYSGEITMREALVHSKNVATIRLAEQVGLSRVVQMARSLGISSDIPHYPSVAIGAAEVTLLDMVTAYATFATLGDRPEPRFITRVEDRDGRVIWQVPSRSRRALASDVAFLTVDLMRDVVDRGTGAAARAAGFGGPAAGKTGTTNESADVWFVGFTPRTVTGVWMGMDRPQRIMGNATGGRLAAPVWGRVMRDIETGSGGWSPPPGVETHLVDPRGNVIGSNCPTSGEVREEYFLRGTVGTVDCREYYMGYDSLYPDSAYDDDSWWQRVRDRWFGDEEEAGRTDTTRHDTIIMDRDRGDSIGRARPRDTVRLRPQPPDTMPRPTPRDTIIGDPVNDTTPPDTIRRDTARRDTTPPDTGSVTAGEGGTR